MTEIKLTQFSHGAGCGCKIAPAVLDSILQSSKINIENDPRLLVGHDKKDDAAVFDIGNGRAIISTTDFFMPIVDDAFDFGRIASVNAISDVYAMGGTPMMAVAILGWPINKIPAELAGKVLEGARRICADAGITLAGGHSIDNEEPLFGLAVTGEILISNLKQNSTATEGCSLFLTKPIGVGIFTTAQKRGIVKPEDFDQALQTMLTLNKPGETFGKLSYVKAMTDVTGFGLLGHLGEMVDGSNLSAEIEFSKVPKLTNIDFYISQGSMPGGTKRNWESYGNGIEGVDEYKRSILCDPQTSGGLLVAVEQGNENEFISVAESIGLQLECFGKLVKRGEARILVR
ncbi:MAG: selenide, water dikinase SelD [Flavobacteriales bacterium]|nr:MAG: selenide, water dikinase SelD [Flavobacteriales bacterium]